MHRFRFIWKPVTAAFGLKEEPEKGYRPSLCSDGVKNYFPLIEAEFDMLLTDADPSDDSFFEFVANEDDAWCDAQEVEDYGIEEADEIFDWSTDGWFYQVLGSECERFWVKLEAIDGLPTTDS